MAEIKSELKLAKEFIKKKEYKEALKHCKNVMKIDKDNYNALIFIGVCATELEHFEQARQAYQKAIGQNEEQPLAWQGLCSLIEKSEIKEWKTELITAYKKLLQLHVNDDKKWLDYCSKICELLKSEKDHDEFLTILKEKLKRTDDNLKKIEILKDMLEVTQLINFKSSQEKCKEEFGIYKLLLSCYDTLEEKVDYEMDYIKYVEFLIKNLKFLDDVSLKDVCIMITDVFNEFNSNETILLLLCKVSLNLSLFEQLETRDRDILELLKNSDKASHTRCLAMMYCSYEKKNYNDAIQFIEQSFSFNRKDPVAYIYLADCNLKIHQYQKCEDSLQHAIKWKSNSISNELLPIIELKEKAIHLELLIEKNDFHRNEEQIQTLLSQIDGNVDKDHSDIFNVIAHANIICGNIEKAVQIIEGIGTDESCSYKVKCLQLKALVSIQEDNLDDAELRIQEALDLSKGYESHYLLGKIYWQMGKKDNQFYPKSYREFLLAAKLDSNFPHIFFYLGKYQKDLVKDINKAVKCFEKVFVLDSGNDNAMKELADCYFQLELHEKAFNIYQHITVNAKVGEAVWAWMRLGLIYLESHDADNAIICFQNALRGDTSASEYWECLGEGYIEKGSYNSALKAFTKALELDPASLVSKYKIAQIKQLLSLDYEAIDLYMRLLNDHTEYVPAILGLAETYYHLEKDHLMKRFDGKAVDFAQLVVDIITRGVQFQPRLISLWKTLGDCLLSLFPVHQNKCELSFKQELLHMLSADEECKVFKKKSIIELSIRCYIMVIKLDENNATYWHDLALATFRLGVVIGGPTGREKVLQSIKLIKQALCLDNTDPMIWNTFGVISGSSGPLQMCCGHAIDELDNPAVAQHAFINALQLNDQDSQVWCNLGVLYFKHNKVEPAHEAFKRAQACNPANAQAWIGQAMIAESIADEDAMDLFRHSTELLFHEEGSQAYAQWIFRQLYDFRHKSALINTEACCDFSHLPKRISCIMSSSLVALARSIERLGDSACAYNTLGLLYEHQHLYLSAEQSFASARAILSSEQPNEVQNEQLRKVLLNQARVLRLLGKFEDAIEIYSIVSLQTCEELCQLGLTYYKAQKFNEALTVYNKALSVAENDGDKSDVLTVIGMVEYVNKDIQSAKTSLFKSAQLSDCSEHGLLALTSLGLLHGDVTLATATLNELSKQNFSDSKSLELKKAKIFSSFYLLQGEHYKAKRSICKAILRYPDNSTLWCLLTRYMKMNSTRNFETVNTILLKAKNHGPSEIVSKMEAICCESYPVDDSKRLIRVAKQLVHSYPDACENWVLLASIVQVIVSLNERDEKSIKLLLSITKLALTKVDSQLNILKTMSKATSTKSLSYYTKLYSWIMKSYIVANIYYGDKELAQTLCAHIIPSLSSNDGEQEEFMFLRNLAVLCSETEDDDIELLRRMSSIAMKKSDENLLKMMSSVYKYKGYYEASEIYERQLLQLSIQSNKPQAALLSQMFITYIKLFVISKNQQYIVQSQQILDELSKRFENSSNVIFMKAIQFFYQGNKKAALKYLGKLKDDINLHLICERFDKAWQV